MSDSRNKDNQQLNNQGIENESVVSHFLGLRNPMQLCRFLKVRPSALQDLINEPRYREFVIPKKNGSNRLIHAPSAELTLMQKELNNGLQKCYNRIRPISSHGFISKNKKATFSIVSNAKPHVGKKYVLNIDLKDFFQSISARKVKHLFLSESFLFDEHMASALALLLTYKGKLPQGAPTSPVISNYICLNLDRNMQSWTRFENVTYTRYADDMTFSSDEPFTDKFIEEIRRMVSHEGFELNNKKIRRKGRGRKQVVTGLIVNEKVNVDRKLIRKIRAMLHDIRLNGLDLAAMHHYGPEGEHIKNPEIHFYHKVEGYISFIGMVRGKDDLVYLGFKQQLNKVFHLQF